MNNKRKCIVNNISFEKEELIRISFQNKKAILDINKSLKGRGVYFKKDKQTIDNIIKSNNLKKEFNKRKVDLIYYETIINQLKEYV